MERKTRGLAGFIIERVLSRRELPESTRNAELGELQGRTSAIINIMLVLLKGGLAAFSGSVALFADALNNLGDIAGSLVLIFGFRLSQKPRDRDHPYGHGRLRTVAGFVLSIILILVGIEAARSGIMRIIDPQTIKTTPWLLAAIAGSIVLKAWLANFSRLIAGLTGDAGLKSEAWNHFYDILSTLLVLLALFCARYDLPSIDGWAGIAISIFILYTGIRYAGETIGILIGKAPSAEALEEIHRIAHLADEVESVHDIQIHEYGNMRLITLHIEMDAAMSAIECHRLTEKVEDNIANQLQAKVIVHGDPVDLSHPEYRRISSLLKEFVDSTGDFVDYHDLRVYGESPALDIEVDLVTTLNVTSSDFQDKAEQFRRHIVEQFDGIRKLDIGIETDYASEPEFRICY